MNWHANFDAIFVGFLFTFYIQTFFEKLVHINIPLTLYSATSMLLDDVNPMCVTTTSLVRASPRTEKFVCDQAPML